MGRRTASASSASGGPYRERGRRFEARRRPFPDALCLLVRDHGKLFPEELQPQIAARFFELLAMGRVRDASVSVVGLEATVQVGTVTVNKRPRGRRLASCGRPC